MTCAHEQYLVTWLRPSTWLHPTISAIIDHLAPPSPTPLFEQSLKFIAHGRIFKRLRYSKLVRHWDQWNLHDLETLWPLVVPLLCSLQPRALRFLNHIDPLASVSTPYCGVHTMHAVIVMPFKVYSLPKPSKQPWSKARCYHRLSSFNEMTYNLRREVTARPSQSNPLLSPAAPRINSVFT